MHSFSTRLLMLAIATQCLLSCSIWRPAETIEAPSASAALRLEEAWQALASVDSTDVLLKFNNQVLAADMVALLNRQSDGASNLVFEDFQVGFKQQFIQLTTHLQTYDNQGQMIKATATGEIQLRVSADGLEWYPNLDQIQAQPSDVSLADGIQVEPASEWAQQLLRQINGVLKKHPQSGDFHYISFQAVPLADIEVGTRLPSFNDATSVQSAPIRGMFFVKGSAILIDPIHTTVLLDMSFKSNLAVCPADISVSRAMFANEINNREPVADLHDLVEPDDVNFFFSEIVGATRPMTIIHYWFADGRPMAVEELPIGPSEKWRTWSSKGVTGKAASHWRVLVVDKESGCIMHSQSIRTERPQHLSSPSLAEPGPSNFADYRDAFRNRMADFPAAETQPRILVTSIRRQFLSDVIQAGLGDLQIETSFDEASLAPGNHRADLLPFETQHIACQNQKCPEPVTCTANIAHCTRQRDSRDCNSCLFHNPLNNRCISVEKDPICVAAKNRINAIYESDWDACIAAAELGREDCQQLSRQIAQSCEIENQAAKSACEASKTEIQSLDSGAMLASVMANSQIKGQLSTVFSNFTISGDFDQLQQDVTLKTRLQITGELEFEPASTQWPLSSCINTWKGTFSNRSISSIPLNSMLSSLRDTAGSFSAEWSGIVLPLKMNASPLESVFVSNPRLLATCNIGLTVQQVEQAMRGADADFFNGGLKLVIQPLPTRVNWRPATIQLAGKKYTGLMKSQMGFLDYTMQPD